MTDPEPDPAADPWLTLAEIAKELRVNPATVRLWVSRHVRTRTGRRERGFSGTRARVIPGFTWEPVSDTESMILSKELRPGANRPGPDHLWDSFDLTVERVALAMQGNDASLVYIEYMELAIVLREIIEALELGSASPSGSAAGGGAGENDAGGVDQSVI